GNGQCLIAFGDTNGEGWGGFGGGPRHADWRSNVLAFSTDRNPQDGLSFDGMVTDRPGHAAEILVSKKINEDEETVIPTAGISVGKRQIIHYMSVNFWPPFRPWVTNYAGFAYSDDGGRKWTKAPTAIWRNDAHNHNNFQMAALVKDEKWVYWFATRAGRQSAVYLARVPHARVLDKSAYRYWNGTDFKSSLEGEARPIVPRPVSELSVSYHRHFRRWLMTYLDPQRQAIVMRDAPALTGPWTGEKILLREREYPGLYGGYMHPWFMDKPEMYFMLSEWPLYNVAWMRAGLIPASVADAGNLLSNPGFEDVTKIEGLGVPWRLDGGGGLDRDLNFARSGRSNAYLRQHISGLNHIAQTICVRPGQAYRFTAWVRTSENNRRGSLGVQNRNGDVLQEKSFDRLGDYTRMSVNFTPDRHTTQVDVFVGMRVHHGQDTWMQIDDLSVVAL
ncbi:MAG: hypothetical protein JWN98_752, partial [Abditibacteriota bacterium]|nr:hypothetical protein [Abditibacteriota bacterium]